MKLRLNKSAIASMHPRVAAVVEAWRTRYRKSSITVLDRASVYIAEDGKYTAINLTTGKQKEARASGEWAGLTELRCNATVTLPAGCVMVEEMIFCGLPMLTIYTGTAAPSREQITQTTQPTEGTKV